ncbi:peptidyl-prolyl cis-trans isomerase [Bradyrhizobium sp. WSM 1738]|uniref:peptidylprolyl isomerase n=1 Tax=Bradyrhizobium hereditatis TaxID=2821405 RepID=UPI001CE28D13|nr:peptidylprolyl isomerase [Bradyrhizobium hereditatis]MCA6118154.1 peptidyl-prolyl cis-trans isomerase [Bradyrhizobium hereditatis]
MDRSTRGTAERSDSVSDATLVTQPSIVRRLANEPLLHFLVVGLILFVVYDRLHPDLEAKSESNRIVLTPADFEQLGVTWLAQGRAPPTPAEMQSLIELKVREEVLYREALALGLDKNDTIVKRRLAQKMEFLAEGASIDSDPSTDMLRAWFKDNPQRFSLPPRVSFRHVYFSPDQHGERSREAAAKAMEQLAGRPGDFQDAAALGDPFMDRDYYGDRSAEDMAKLFGSNFAREVAGLKPGRWHGPIESGYGWHLVFIDTSVPSRVPDFEEIEPEIKAEWIEDQRAQAKRKAYETMRARYQVVTPERAKN